MQITACDTLSGTIRKLSATRALRFKARDKAYAACAWLTCAFLPVPGWTSETDPAEIVVTATRIPFLIRDEPLRVEAVPTEEIEENLTIQPGNLSSLLKELPGARVQPTVPSLGGAGLQLRGMPPRHTVALMDGLPLLGAEADAFGLLQTPPLDLKQVELIKGAASALYGAAALGGVLNLVSQTADAESAVLANLTSGGGRDLVGFLTAKGTSRWSGTVTAGAHDQDRRDLNRDGWADSPGFRRYTVRPRLWFEGDNRRSLFLTAGIVDEDRTGGTVRGRLLPDGRSFAEVLRTRRFDAGAVYRGSLREDLTSNGRVSLTSSHLERTFGVQRIGSTQTTAFVEEAVNGQRRNHDWVIGVAFARDELAVPHVPGVSYTYNVPALFAQDEFPPRPWLKLAASARIDAHNRYGTFFSPRLSALWRAPASDWSLRASVAGGFAAPTPFVEEIEATSLAALAPLQGVHAERAMTTSLDAKWADLGWDVNASVFISEIRNPLEVRSATGDRLELVNAPGARRVPGAEVLIRYLTGPLQLIASWCALHATEGDAQGGREDSPGVPRHVAELAGILENEKRGRIGLELGYTGQQALRGDPYRSRSEPYFELNVLGEIRVKGIAVFLNAINLTDERQTHFDPLLRPTPGPGGDPITDVWAPLEGRVFNLGIRAEL